MKIKVILTGATGMVGEGVLFECLDHADVEKILLINRRPSGVAHPKVKEIIHRDFFELGAIESQVHGYDACFFCLGMSAVGLSQDEYHRGTYELTLNFARTLLKHNENMVFNYVSGAGTDSSEKRKAMWARVKGKTENALINLGFRRACMFRPAIMEATKGQKNTLKLYNYFSWLIPAMRVLFPNYICTLRQVGQAMINAVTKGYEKPILEVADIVALSSGQTSVNKVLS